MSITKAVFVEVSDEGLDVIKWNDKNTGAPRSLSKQKMYLHGGGKYPVPFEGDVDDIKGPLRPGFYLIGGDCFGIVAKGNKGFTGLGFNARNLDLVPVEDAIKEITALKGLQVGPKIAAV